MNQITLDKALKLAQCYIEYLNETRPFHPDYTHGFSGPINYEECWYFDFCTIAKPHIPKEERVSFAGAPGFIVSKADEQVRTISWGDYSWLQKKEVKLKRINQLVEEFMMKPVSLRELRQLLDLKPAELLDLKRRIDKVDLSSEEKKTLLKVELKKQIKEE